MSRHDNLGGQAGGSVPPTLLELLSGSWVSQSIYVAAKLGIADFLKDGPKTSEELADSVGANGQSLYRVMRALSSVGVFAEMEGGRFSLTPLSALLQTGVPGSLRAWAIMLGEEPYRAAWGALLHTVKTGETAFNRVYSTGRFEYLARHPEAAKTFNEAMIGLTTQAAMAAVAAYDFAGARTIIDVGGGHGILLEAVLKANPHLGGVLFETPTVIEGAKKRLEACGLGGRCKAIGGDFFHSVPSGGDVYTLSAVIHDWDDERSITILKNCHRALGGKGKLLLLELVLPPSNERSFATLMDINMMVITGGRERTESEYRALLTAASFKLTRIIPTQSPRSLIEGVPV